MRKPKDNNPVSIKEIAKLAGVSVATVSKVLNNKGNFSQETREKIFKLAEELNYQTNMIARSLRVKKSGWIGVIVPDITNEFFALLVLHIESLCFNYGYTVFVCNTNEEKEKENKYLKELQARGVDGVIYIAGQTDIPQGLLQKELPIVCIDRRPKNIENVVIIESENYKGGYIATEELIKKGCKRIVILKDRRRVSTVEDRFRGYMNALKDNGIEVDESLIVNVNVSFEEGRKAILELINKKVEFDGIFACTDWLAIGALVALKEQGIEVPQQVKIVGFDDISIARHSYPAITTVRQDVKQMGEIAVNALIKMIDGKKVSTSHVYVPVELVRRSST